MSNRVSRVVDFAGDLLSDGQMKGLRLSNFGGTFIKPEENQSRGDSVRGSYDFIPDVLEEEQRVVAGDPLRKNRSRPEER